MDMENLQKKQLEGAEKVPEISKISPERQEQIDKFGESLNDAFQSMDELDDSKPGYALEAQKVSRKIYSIASELLSKTVKFQTGEGSRVVIENPKDPKRKLIVRFKETSDKRDRAMPIWVEEVSEVDPDPEEKNKDIFKKTVAERLAVNPDDNYEPLAISVYEQGKKMIKNKVEFEPIRFTKDPKLAKKEELGAIFEDYKNEIMLRYQSSIH